MKTKAKDGHPNVPHKRRNSQSNKTTRTTTSSFLIDGVRCELAIDDQAIRWWPSSTAQQQQAEAPTTTTTTTTTPSNSSDSNSNRKTIKSLYFSHVIGIKIANSSGKTKFALNNGTGRLGYGSPIRLPAAAAGLNAKKGRKIKIYYAKHNENKSTGQLLKLKKLSIEWQPGSKSNVATMTATRSASVSVEAQDEEVEAEATGKMRQQQQHLREASSEPPSCYASDGGSNSQLSSMLTMASSSSTTTTTNSSPVEPQLYHPPQSFGPNKLVDTTNSGGPQQQRVAGELDKLVRQIEEGLRRQRQARPQRLLVFVNPFGGKGKAVQLYKLQVRRLFELAGVEVKLVVTKYANHARDTIEDPLFNVEYFDGIVCVGGDGMFSELMNGLLFRYNRLALLKAEARRLNSASPTNSDSSQASSLGAASSLSPPESLKASGGDITTSSSSSSSPSNATDKLDDAAWRLQQQQQRQQPTSTTNSERQQLDRLKLALGGIGQQFVSPPVPLGVIGAGSTDANSFGLIGTNDVITATLNIILGNQINIDVCSIHTLAEDRLLRFVSTFVGYGYFGDVIRESEKLRWLGPSRYDVTGVNTLMKNRTYKGLVKILISSEDSSPSQGGRCCVGCSLCQLHQSAATKTTTTTSSSSLAHDTSSISSKLGELRFVEKQGPFVGVNAAVTACRCPQTKKGFSPNNHLANGCADLILVHPCTRLQYIQYLMRTAGTKKSAFDLKYVEAFRCRQFEFVASEQQQQQHRKQLQPIKSGGSLSSGATSSTNSIDQTTDGGGSSNQNNSTTTSTTIITNNSNKEGPNDQQQLPAEQDEQLLSSWNADGEILDEQSVRVKVNSQLLRVFGTGEPLGTT